MADADDDANDPTPPPAEAGATTPASRRAARPKQKQPGPSRVPPRERRHGLVTERRLVKHPYTEQGIGAQAQDRAVTAVASAWEVVRGVAHAPAPTRVTLVRHGETEWNARGVYQGSRDVPLSPTGRAQARALGERLAAVRFDVAYTSPLARARETAELVLAGRGPAACPAPELGEFGYGVWEGVPPAERRARWPELDARWAADPWAVALPGGESLDALAARVLPAWERLLGAHPGGTVAVFAHGHVNRLILLHARGLPRAAFWSVAQPNASAVLLECCPDAE